MIFGVRMVVRTQSDEVKDWGISVKRREHSMPVSVFWEAYGGTYSDTVSSKSSAASSKVAPIHFEIGSWVQSGTVAVKLSGLVSVSDTNAN